MNIKLKVIIAVIVTLILMGMEYIHRGYFGIGGEVFAPSIALAVIEYCKAIRV